MSLRLITLVYLWDSFIFTKSYVYVSSYYGNFQYPVLFKSSARLWVWNYVQPRICLLLGHNDTGDTYILYTCLKLHGIWYVLSSVDSISVVAPHQLPAFLPLPPPPVPPSPSPPVPLSPSPSCPSLSLPQAKNDQEWGYQGQVQEVQTNQCTSWEFVKNL